jgi:hypothetical protein
MPAIPSKKDAKKICGQQLYLFKITAELDTNFIVKGIIYLMLRTHEETHEAKSRIKIKDFDNSTTFSAEPLKVDFEH